MSIRFQRVGKDDFRDVARVFNESRGTVVPKEFFKRKFTSPTDVSYIGVMAYAEGGQPVCHVGIVPLWMSFKGQRILAGTFADTVTHPDYRRQGIFKEASDRLHAEALQQGVKLVFRLPNPTTYNGLVKHLGYTHVDDMYEFSFAVSSAPPVLKFMEKFRLDGLKRWYLNLICSLSGANREPFPSSVARQGLDHVIRDHGYLAYKTYQDNFFLRIGDDRLWMRAEDGIIIGDFQTDDVKQLVVELRGFCRRHGIHRFRFFVGGRTKEFEALSAFSTPRVEKPVCVLPLDETCADVRNFALTYADNDVF